MRKFRVYFGAVVVFWGVAILVSSAFAAQDGNGSRVVAYYFHGTMRCPTCRNLERYSKEALETYFKDAFASGKLEFNVLNVEQKANEHYANDYQLYTKSLVLTLVKDGKQVKWINLDKIWEYVRNKRKFLIT
ncbi:MAG: nitrophenyl compound nitroreductase subunit ArsF family protein [Candidatus Omnitrophota bacterium]